MKQVAIELFLHLTGIGSASGLVYREPDLYVIGDNSSYLYRYDTNIKQLHSIGLTENPQANIPKPIKPDYEAIASHEDKLYLLGSGSTDQRIKMSVYDTKNQTVSHQDLTQLYNRFKSEFQLADDQLNLEGFVFHADNMLFFQRGNGSANNNGIFIVSSFDPKSSSIDYIPVSLPAINGIPSSFTDAAMANNRIFFLASAEDSQSTYLDGEVAGSLFGELDLNTFSVISYKIIHKKHKFEGLTFLESKENKLIFLLCEDNDTDILVSQVYKLTVEF